VGVAREPVAETGWRGGGTVRDEQSRHQAADFVASEDDVAGEAADSRNEQERDCGTDVNDPCPGGESAFDDADEVVEGVGFGTDRVEGDVPVAISSVDRDAGEVANVDRLKAVAAVAGDGKERKFAEQPRDVVGKDFVVTAEEVGGAQDCIRQTGVGARLFDDAFAAKVGERRVGGGIGDADVHEAADAGAFGGVDEGLDVGDGALEGHRVMGKANPVGIEDGINAGEALGERFGAVEVEGSGLDCVTEGIGTYGMGGEAADVVAAFEEKAGDIAAGVAERARDNVEVWHVERKAWHKRGMQRTAGVIRILQKPLFR